MSRNIEYVRVLDRMSLIGRKDCDIFYVEHKGNFVELSKMAVQRNCTIISISKKNYEAMEKKLRFAEGFRNGVPLEVLLEALEYY